MVEALRGLGYSTAAALADIIDNSISARATNVEVRFAWAGVASTVLVIDDGIGMDEQELDAAMRLGARNPLDKRANHDLGRFGLGLKTASFSQCRSLTVASVKHGKATCLRWDLDVLAASTDDGWRLLEGPAEGSIGFLEPLFARTQGTLVLWEKMDRLVTPGFKDQDFLDLVDNIERHLALVYHRLIGGPQPRMRLKINGRTVVPIDPFLTGHSATWSSPVDTVVADGTSIQLQCHVLPHKDRLDAREFEYAAGPDGWTAHQGFYVYRNERLLVAGSWLGLGAGRSWTKEEAHRLARIRLDIPNSADAEWKLDIRKSTARPPVSLRARLTRIAEDTRARARRVFAHRGRLERSEAGRNAISQAWRVEHFQGGMRYRIDDTHPAIRSVLDDAKDMQPQVRAMLSVIEETIPVQRIWLDTAEAKETPRTAFAGESATAVLAVMETVYRNMIHRKGLAPAAARERLRHTEPFHHFPELIAGLIDKPSKD